MIHQIFAELPAGVYSARHLNPPGGEDCTHLLVRDDGTLGWCDEYGEQAEDGRGYVSRFTAEELCDDGSEGEDELVTVEIMPEQHRGSHRACGNWGVYPHNGATRERMTRVEAEELCEGDEYNHIVEGS